MTATSPFRYPGAKGRMAKLLLPLIVPHVEKSGTYCEPFIGGGSMALAVAAAVPAARLVLNDADPHVSAFWLAITDERDARGLCRMIAETVPTVELHAQIRAGRPTGLLDSAFRALFLNRTSFSGIIGSGPIGGLEQRSKWTVGCRWNAARLCAQVIAAHELLRGRAGVTCKDFRAVLSENGAPCYLDPPYWEKGRMCYPTSMMPAHHVELARILRDAAYPWVLSYDAHPEVAKLYAFAEVLVVDAAYSMSGAGRSGWVDAREFVIHPRVSP